MRSSSPPSSRHRMSLTPSPGLSHLTAYANASNSVKIWELPRLIDLLAYSQPKPPRKQKREKTHTATVSLSKAIVTHKPEKTLERPRLRLRLTKKSTTSRGLSPAYPPSFLDSSPSPPRSKPIPRPIRRKQAQLQPLRLAGLQGLSDPCIHVLNYCSSQEESRPIRSSYKVLRTAQQESTGEIPECVGETIKITHIVRPTPPHYPRECKRKSVIVLPKHTELEGWADPSPLDFSPMGID